MSASESVARPSATVGEEIGRLLQLAWPVALAQLGAMLMGVVDVVMVGQLGEGSLAAVSLGHTYTFGLALPVMGFSIGLDPLLSQAFGGGRPGRARRTLLLAVGLSTLLLVPITLLHLFPEPVLSALGQPEGVVQEAVPYVRVRVLAVLPFAAFAFLRQFLQAAGRMWPGAVAIVLGNVANILVNGVLVFGLFGAPRLEVVGASWATVVSTGLMAATLVAILVLLPGRERAPDREAPAVPVGRLLAVAAPVALQVSLEGWGFSIATFLVGWFGETALAAHAVAITLASLAFMVPLGVSSAAATRVGNLLGAGHDWRRSGWLSIGIGAGAMGVFATLFLTVPRWLAWPFVDSPDAVALAALLLPVAAGFALFDGVQVVTFGVLRGAGDTTVPAIANIVGYYLVGMPLGAALALGLGLGAVGVWVGLAIALATVAAILVVRLVFTMRRGGYAVG